MTCVIGLVEHDGTIYFGADSAVSGSYQLTIQKDQKVFFVEDFLIGCTGSARMRQLLHHALVPPKYTPGHDVEKYIVTAFVDAVRKCLKDGGFAQKEEEQEKGGDFLVGFRGRLFYIDSDYQLIEPLDGYGAIGSGDDVALGVLFATRDLDMLPQQRIELALKAAEHHTTEVRAPFTLLQYPEKST
jgi:ATP-dependent protease HslVU (ClpYQ) peptidase subunit